MAARPYWSGQFKVSLVSFGIQLFPATQSQSGVTFHQLDRETGQRIRHRNVVGDDEPVQNSEIVKGYEYTKGKYLIVEPDEIAKLRVETKSVIDVQQFVALDELPPALFEKPYFVVPDPRESAGAFAVVRKAMEQTGKAALGEIAFAGREHLTPCATRTSCVRARTIFPAPQSTRNPSTKSSSIWLRSSSSPTPARSNSTSLKTITN
jgi:DNA end-binding protein Ku